MKLFITTYDGSSHILKQFQFLADKYIPEFKEIYVLGYSIFPVLSDRFKLVSIADKQQGIASWTRDYHKVFSAIEDEFIFVCMDDMFPASVFDHEIFNRVMQVMKLENNIGRYELGVGHTWHGKTQTVLGNTEWTLYEYGEDSEYRISCMPSVWRKEYLLKYMNNDWTPWQFEIEGSKLAKTDGYKVIATRGKYALKCNHTVSSTRYPNLFNISELDPDVVKEMISLGLLDRKEL